MDVVPLFYDANKAPPEIITRETLFNGLKRAHDYSGIGQVSNSLTKLWNKPDPDIDAAKLLTMYNNYVIDAAKTGFVNSYDDHPESKVKVNKAIGGKTGRMPWFFQFSKNGRHNLHARASKKKKYLNPNESTMNRMWRQFSDIGPVNLNFAEVKPFNWMMLLSGKPGEINFSAVNTFCELDDSNTADIIESQQEADLGKKEQLKSYDILRDIIIEELTNTYGSLEAVYPSIVKYLFTDENFNKATHKQMFWRVFGEIAARNIQANVLTCHVCSACGIRIPEWYPFHECPTQVTGFVTCRDCNRVVPRLNSRQIRCPECQKNRSRMLAAERKRRQRKKVA